MVALKLALRPWRIAPFTQILAAFVMTFLLVWVASMAWLTQSLSRARAQLAQERTLVAYLDPHLEPGQFSQSVDSIRTQLGSAAKRAELTTVEPEAFLGKLRDTYPDLARQVDALGPEAKLVVPRYVTVRGALADADLDAIKKINGVEGVASSDRRVAPVRESLRGMHALMRLLMLGVGVVLVVSLAFLGRVNQPIHAPVSRLLCAWGYSDLHTRMPSILSGALSMAISAMLAGACWGAVSRVLGEKAALLSPHLRNAPSLSGTWIVALFLGAIVLGGAVGWWNGRGVAHASH